MIAARVGIDRFCEALSCVNQCDLYAKALQRPQPYADQSEHLLFSHSFAKLFKSQEGSNLKNLRFHGFEAAAVANVNLVVVSFC